MTTMNIMARSEIGQTEMNCIQAAQIADALAKAHKLGEPWTIFNPTDSQRVEQSIVVRLAVTEAQYTGYFGQPPILCQHIHPALHAQVCYARE
jgi:hypothetical protein